MIMLISLICGTLYNTSLTQVSFHLQVSHHPSQQLWDNLQDGLQLKHKSNQYKK